MSQNVRPSICIDLDGPILDVSERYYRVYRDTLTSIGFEPLDKESYWNLKRNKISESEIVAHSGTRDSELLKRYLDARAKLIESAEYLLCDQVWPRTHNTLKILKAYGTLVLVTMRTAPDLLDEQLDRLKLREAFDCILTAGPAVTANDRGEQKARLVRDFYRGDDLTGWFVGDTETDILSGHLLGLRTTAITFGIRTVEHLQAVSPDVMLHTPAEFQSWASQISTNN